MVDLIFTLFPLLQRVKLALLTGEAKNPFWLKRISPFIAHVLIDLFHNDVNAET